MLHPVYDNDKAVGQLTEMLLEADHTIFQLWLLDPDERTHSLKVLGALDLPRHATVLSLGCGVGGMEVQWRQGGRHDLSFQLLNISRSQLDLCMCPGHEIHERAENYLRGHLVVAQVTLIAYALGHMDARAVLELALEKTSGPVIVLDAFDGSDEFKSKLYYDSPSSELMLELGFHEVDVGPWVLNPFVIEQGSSDIVSQSTPKLWISE